MPDRSRADSRPRIYIAETPAGATYAFSPAGPRNVQLGVGYAVEAALDRIERKPAVIIFEGANHG